MKPYPPLVHTYPFEEEAMPKINYFERGTLFLSGTLIVLAGYLILHRIGVV